MIVTDHRNFTRPNRDHVWIARFQSSQITARKLSYVILPEPGDRIDQPGLSVLTYRIDHPPTGRWQPVIAGTHPFGTFGCAPCWRQDAQQWPVVKLDELHEAVDRLLAAAMIAQQAIVRASTQAQEVAKW